MAQTNCSQPDWIGSLRTYGLAWGAPIVAIIVGLFLDAVPRTAIWTIALAWMGTACLLNAMRCGRTYCRYTGPFYLAMILPVLIAGLGIISVSFYGWIVLAAISVLGSKLILWWMERALGKFTRPARRRLGVGFSHSSPVAP